MVIAISQVRSPIPAASSELATSVATAAQPTVALAPSSPTTSTAITDRPTADSRAVRSAVLAALSGSPEALVAFMNIQLRNSQASSQSRIASAASESAHEADLQRQQAAKKAEEAAHAATGFLGLGDVLGWVVKIATIVVGAAASVVTGGALAGVVAAAGAILLTCGDDIAKGLSDAGIIPHDMVEHVAMALKLTGAIMMGGGVLGVATGIAGAALTTYAGDIAKGLADAHVIARNDVGTMTAGLSIAGSLVGMAGGALASGGATVAAGQDAMVTEVARTTATAGRELSAAASVGAAGMSVAGGVENHESAERNADAKAAGGRGDGARATQDAAADEVRDVVKSIAKLMGHLRDIEEAQSRAHRVAAQGRA